MASLQVSRDPYRNASSQHQTQVEPDSFGFGSTEVTTFQSGRFVDGGASNIGWATTTDAGLTWKSGFLPGLTMFGAPRASIRGPATPSSRTTPGTACG